MGKEFSEQEIVDAIHRLTKAEQKLNEHSSSAVRLRAAERDFMEAAKILRDMLVKLTRASTEAARSHLCQVFEPNRLQMLTETVASATLSPVNAKNVVWVQLQEEVKGLPPLLEDYGMKKKWGMTKPPKSVKYPTFLSLKMEEMPFVESGACTLTVRASERGKRLTPGKEYEFVPDIEDQHALGKITFRIEPALPDGLVIDDCTGVISGCPSRGVECQMRPYFVTLSNAQGMVRDQLNFAVRDPPPHELSYPALPSGTRLLTGDERRAEPQFDSGPPTSFEVSPHLPVGLRLDEARGTISGIATTVSPSQVYTIKALNSSGFCITKLTLEVSRAPPLSLEYLEVPKVVALQASLYLVPTVDMERSVGAAGPNIKWGRVLTTMVGAATAAQRWGKLKEVAIGTSFGIHEMDLTFSVDPPLPPGINLAKKTGIIFGVANEEVPRTSYTVTATNDAGSCKAALQLEVRECAPEGLAYLDSEKLLTGVFFNWDAEILGRVETWSVDPPLPEGVSLDTTGSISGAPTKTCKLTEYTVTAANKIGKTTCTIKFAVKQEAPRDLVYKEIKSEYPIGAEMSLSPHVIGDVSFYKISPKLPKGLQIHPTTGVISGTPAEQAEKLVFSVLAMNDSGSCKTSIVFSLRMAPPSGLSYPHMDDQYSVAESIHLMPSVTGNVTKWHVSPSLPEGLAINPETGAIMGSPTDVQEEKSYTIIAENDEGGTSTVITFGVTSGPPEGLKYPEIPSTDPPHVVVLVCGQPVEFNAQLKFAVGAQFKVEPPLLPGIELDEKTGTISGVSMSPFKKRSHIVTAYNDSGQTQFTVWMMCVTKTNQQLAKSEHFANELEQISDLVDLPPDPLLKDPEKTLDWMLWIVHRLYLNDPTLLVVDFSNREMPLPTDEPRISTKMAKALVTNKHCTSLRLCNSNLRGQTGIDLAAALKKNTALQILNLECNYINPDTVVALCDGLIANPESAVNTIKIDSQFGIKTLGRLAEENLVSLAKNNGQITHIGYQFAVPHCLDQSSRALMKNADTARRARRQKQVEAEREEQEKKILNAAAEKKQLSRIVLANAPAKVAAWEIFDDNDASEAVYREYCAINKQLPTVEQLTQFATEQEKPLSHAAVATLIRGSREKLFNAYISADLVLVTPNGSEYIGSVVRWSEKNERFFFDIWPSHGSRMEFEGEMPIPIELKEHTAHWLMPCEKRVADDGWGYTWEEFEAFYGEDDAEEAWVTAPLFKPQVA